MHRIVTALALTALFSSHVHAKDGGDPSPMEVLGLWLAAELSGGIGGLSSGITGAFIAIGKDSRADDLVPMAMAWGVFGGTTVSAATVNLIGDKLGYKGSFWGALAGGLVGSGASVAILYLLQPEADLGIRLEGVGFWSFLVLPATGVTLGYLLSHDIASDDDQAAALVRVDAHGSVSLGAPAVSIAPEREGGLRIDALILDARF